MLLLFLQFVLFLELSHQPVRLLLKSSCSVDRYPSLLSCALLSERIPSSLCLGSLIYCVVYFSLKLAQRLRRSNARVVCVRIVSYLLIVFIL